MVQCVLVIKVTGYSLKDIVQVCVYYFNLYINFINAIAEINECSENKGICATDKVCFNTPGSYLCLCNVGYWQSANGSCEGI